METLCLIRNIYQSISDYEGQFADTHSLCLNEGMLLCLLQMSGSLTSSGIAAQLGLSPSNTSKVIKMVEEKGMISRKLGEQDKRQMYFALTETGQRKIKEIHEIEITLPPLLQTVVQSGASQMPPH